MALVELKSELEREIGLACTAANRELKGEGEISLSKALETISCNLYAAANRAEDAGDGVLLSGWIDVSSSVSLPQPSSAVDWRYVEPGPIGTEQQQAWTQMADWLGPIELAAPVVAALAPAVPANTEASEFFRTQLTRSVLLELLRAAGLHGLTDSVWSAIERLRKAKAQQQPAVASSVTAAASSATAGGAGGAASSSTASTSAPADAPEGLAPFYSVADEGRLLPSELDACLKAIGMRKSVLNLAAESYSANGGGALRLPDWWDLLNPRSKIVIKSKLSGFEHKAALLSLGCALSGRSARAFACASKADLRGALGEVGVDEAAELEQMLRGVPPSGPIALVAWCDGLPAPSLELLKDLVLDEQPEHAIATPGKGLGLNAAAAAGVAISPSLKLDCAVDHLH